MINTWLLNQNRPKSGLRRLVSALVFFCTSHICSTLDAIAGSIKVPGGVFFHTTPLTPPEIANKNFSDYTIAEVELNESAKLIKTDQDGGTVHEISLNVRRVYSGNYIQNGIYKIQIIDLTKFGKFDGSPVIQLRDDEFDYSDILYCLIDRKNDGTYEVHRRSFVSSRRF